MRVLNWKSWALMAAGLASLAVLTHEAHADGLYRELWSAGARLTGTNVAGAPFSADAVVETVQKLGDGNTIERSSRVRVYRDSAGRTREELLGNEPGSDPRLVIIGDPKSGHVTRLFAGEKRYQRRRGPWDDDDREEREADERAKRDREEQEERAKEERSREDGPRWVSLGKRNIEGVQADGTRRTQLIPAGRIGNKQDLRIVTERWHSEELGVDVLWSRSDPRRGTTSYKLTNIQRIAPLSTLFEPPPGYRGTEDDDDNDESE